ncbi:hypothetical protein [Lentilactobacillus sp. Marseille-Q4993]|uniref:hypothetical protein n=1 Tax=Lentilactobacillus sp. Marseille-Q4993 TaxID=3039492 RepID=UPI0024BC320E|nr:hypothetical protein [Lentilactobacillus sp. Marseille-Q4993]
MTANEPNDDLAQLFFDHYYHDRGMLKWQGYYLSDHTSALNHQKEVRSHIVSHQVAEQMEMADIETTINTSITKHIPVSIQSNIKDDNGTFPMPITGEIIGYHNSRLYISTQESIEISDIRHINLTK